MGWIEWDGMEEQVFTITELNPSIEMEMLDLLRGTGLPMRWVQGGELFARFDSEGRITGVACASEIGENCLLHFIIVKNGLRGKGIGSALVNHALQYFAGRCKRMYAYIPGEAAFFDRFGFRKVSPDEIPDAVAEYAGVRGYYSAGDTLRCLNLSSEWSMT